jgi:hypothetical protein
MPNARRARLGRIEQSEKTAKALKQPLMTLARYEGVDK